MKKLIFALTAVVSLIALFNFNGCSEDVVTIKPVTTTKGVFVLYEGVFPQAASYDYGFIDPSNGNVQPNVYQNSNSGAHLNSVPDGMLLSGNDLYITAQGTFSQPGSIYKINSTSNQLISSRGAFGRNPYNLTIDNSKIYVTNIASSFVSIMDLNFSPVTDSLEVGPNPTDITALNGKIFVAKATYTFENSLAIINESNNQVDKIFFNSAPVSVTGNSGSIYVSGYLSKKIYKIDANSNNIIDSSGVISSSFPAITDIVSGDNNTLFAVTYDTATFSTKEVYKYDIPGKTFTLLIPNGGGQNDVYGIAYDAVEGKIYIANSKGGSVNGEVKAYSKTGNLLNTYTDIGGKFPKRIVFKY
jgi:YVTN family beta-propeller protein